MFKNMLVSILRYIQWSYIHCRYSLGSHFQTSKLQLELILLKLCSTIFVDEYLNFNRLLNWKFCWNLFFNTINVCFIIEFLKDFSLKVFLWKYLKVTEFYIFVSSVCYAWLWYAFQLHFKGRRLCIRIKAFLMFISVWYSAMYLILYVQFKNGDCRSYILPIFR